MNTKALKQKILDLAIHGKLVPQNPNDESATVLLEKIRAEKAEKIKKGELKADKKDSFIFVGSDKRHYEKFADGSVKDIEDEIPFAVPVGWAWTRLKNIAFITKLAGFEYSKYIEPNLCENGIPLFKGKNVQNSEIIYEFEGYIPEEVSDSLLRSQINKKCILTPYVGTIGNIGIHDKAGKFHLGSNVGKIELLYSELTSEEFVVHYLKSSEGYKQLTKHMKATAQESISMEALRDVLLPLPPKEEQDSIEQKLYNIFDIIRNVEINRNDLDFYIKTAKSKILNIAIHGKLVPQDPNDEPASVLLEKIRADRTVARACGSAKKGELKRHKNDSYIYKGSDNCHYQQNADGSIVNIEDEIPFNVPEGWCWVRIPEISNTIFAGGDKPEIYEKEITESCNIPIFSNGIEKDGLYGYTNKAVVDKPCITISARGTIGYTCIRNEPFVPIVRLVTIIPKEIINLVYIKIVFDSLLVVGEGSSIPQLTVPTVKQVLFPLPPLTEQTRIVAKIEELFTLLDNIQNNLI